MHGHSSERPGMEDNAEAEQNSLAQAEERTRCAGLLRRWPQRSTSSPSGFDDSAGVVAGLRCRLGSSYQKAPRSEPNFAKLIVSTPTKSTICDRLGYLV